MVIAPLVQVLQRVSFSDSDFSHLASGSLWRSWLPEIVIIAALIGLVVGWGNRRSARYYRRAAPGLTDAELASAITALTRDPIPSDPAVRAAAHTFAKGTLARTRWDPLLFSVVGFIFALSLVVSIFEGPVNLYYPVILVLFIALAWSRFRSRRRIAARIESLAPDGAVDAV